MSKSARLSPPEAGSQAELRESSTKSSPGFRRGFAELVVLCELEGLTRQEAARRLGIPAGTLSSRLARAKAALKDRLTRRGLAVPIAVLSAFLPGEAGAAPLPGGFARRTVAAATSRRGRCPGTQGHPRVRAFTH